MLKQIALLIGLTILCVFAAHEAKLLLNYYDKMFTLVEQLLNAIAVTSLLGPMLQESILLWLTPVILTTIPALGYWLIKRQQLPYFYHIIWVIWLITITKLSVI